eukprot:10031439-Alexandrium_andersonii.AAC.1
MKSRRRDSRTGRPRTGREYRWGPGLKVPSQRTVQLRPSHSPVRRRQQVGRVLGRASCRIPRRRPHRVPDLPYRP